MKNLMIVLIALMTPKVFAGQGEFVTVGQTENCHYQTIQEAHFNGATEIRVTNEIIYTEEFSIFNETSIIGGYANCQDAINGVLDEVNGEVNRTVWSGEDQRTVLFITAFFGTDISISNFSIINGRNEAFNQSGGIKVDTLADAPITLTLKNTVLSNNVGHSGGAIYMNEFSTLILNQSTITNNSADFGAGVFCSGGRGQRTHVVIDSNINNNTAEISGGGLYLNNASLQLAATEPYSNAITNNVAKYGGGIYASQSSINEYMGELLGNLTGTDTISIRTNRVARSTEGEGKGGGIYLHNTLMNIEKILLFENQAELQGAGLFVEGDSAVTLKNSWFVENNAINQSVIPTSGGAIYIQGSNYVKIDESEFYENYAEIGSFMVKSGYGPVNIDNSVVAFHVTYPGQEESSSIIHIGGHLPNLVNELNIIHSTFAYNNAQYFLESTDIDGDFKTLFENSILTNGVYEQIYINRHNDERFIINHSGLNSDESLLPYLASGVVELINPLIADDFIFTDPLSGIFSLQKVSPAIDYAPYPDFHPFFPNYSDINGVKRGYDEPTVENEHGSYDLGAYEYFEDVIFASGFD